MKRGEGVDTARQSHSLCGGTVDPVSPSPQPTPPPGDSVSSPRRRRRLRRLEKVGGGTAPQKNFFFVSVDPPPPSLLALHADPIFDTQGQNHYFFHCPHSFPHFPIAVLRRGSEKERIERGRLFRDDTGIRTFAVPVQCTHPLRLYCTVNLLNPGSHIKYGCHRPRLGHWCVYIYVRMLVVICGIRQGREPSFLFI